MSTKSGKALNVSVVESDAAFLERFDSVPPPSSARPVAANAPVAPESATRLVETKTPRPRQKSRK